MMAGAGYTLSVSQLNSYVATVIRTDALLKDLSVRGEISGFKRHSSGHLYFSLKDGEALVRCVMFRQNALDAPRTLRDGMSVVAGGYAALYERDGQFQFYVKNIAEEGEGELYRRFMLLKTRLEARGMFDAAHKKPIPALPMCVGAVTSPTGAVIQDIKNVIRRRYPMMDMVLCPVAVQGEGAAGEIAAGIRALGRDGRADVIIVGRGGGSLEDLWPFNEETVAEAIYASDVPIISAVGHETDFTIADFVADLRAPTPSAAAELAVPEYARLVERVSEMRGRLAVSARQGLERSGAAVASLASDGSFLRVRHELSNALLRAERAEDAARSAVSNAIATNRASLDAASGALYALSPERTLERGYAIVKTGRGYALSAKGLQEGDRAELIMLGGRAEATVTKVIPEEN